MLILLGKKNLGPYSCCKTDLITKSPRAPQNESSFSVWVRQEARAYVQNGPVSVKNSIPTPSVNQEHLPDPSSVWAIHHRERSLPSPGDRSITSAELQVCSLSQQRLMDYLKIFLFRQVLTECVWFFPLFFCWGRQETSFPSCLIQQLCNNPAFTNKWSKVHCFGLWSVFYKDILEKRTPNLWGKWIWPWENGSKQHSLLPSKFRLNAHELLNYHIGEKPRGRITELTVRLLLQTLGFHGNRK